MSPVAILLLVVIFIMLGGGDLIVGFIEGILIVVGFVLFLLFLAALF